MESIGQSIKTHAQLESDNNQKIDSAYQRMSGLFLNPDAKADSLYDLQDQ